MIEGQNLDQAKRHPDVVKNQIKQNGRRERTDVVTSVNGQTGDATLDAASVGALPNETVPIAKGGTGATTAAAALTNLGAVAKAGDTMTGSLVVSKAGEAIVKAINTNTSVALCISASAATTHGLWTYGYYDGSEFHSSAKWMIYRDSAGSVIVNGRAADNVLKSGDTMTGNLHIEQTSGDVYCYAKRTDTSVQAAMGVGGGGANHGIYSWGYNDGSYHSSGKWMIYRNSSGDVIVNGKAENVTGTVAIANGGTGATTAAGARGNIGAVNIAGDTMTGNLFVTKAGNALVQAENSNTGAKLNLDTGSGANHGIWTYGYYDGSVFHSDAKWMIYRGADGINRVNGRATDNVLKSGDTMTGDLTFSVGKAINKTMNDTSNWSPLVYFINNTPSSFTYKPHIGFHNTGGNGSYPGLIELCPWGTNSSPWSRANTGLSISYDDMQFKGQVVRTGTVAVANGGTGATTASDALAALGGSKFVKLWTNSSPTSSFAAQTVAVGGTYNAVLVVAKTAKSSSDYVTCIAVKNLSTYLEGFWSYKYARTVKLTTSGVTFGAGNGGPMTDAMTQSNDYIIPHYIYGITGFAAP